MVAKRTVGKKVKGKGKAHGVRRMTFAQWLVTKRACDGGKQFVGRQTLEEAWATCTDGHYMLWLLHRTLPKAERAFLTRVFYAGAALCYQFGTAWAPHGAGFLRRIYPKPPRIRSVR